VTHPLHRLASLDARARIRAAVDDNCVPSLDPERHADCITRVVLSVRVPDPQTEARRIASLTIADALQTEGSIA
jgi:hypothetical protein